MQHWIIIAYLVGGSHVTRASFIDYESCLSGLDTQPYILCRSFWGLFNDLSNALIKRPHHVLTHALASARQQRRVG